MMKWILRQIFERVARGASTALHVVFADRTVWQARQGEPDVTMVFRTSSAKRRAVLLGYVGFFEAYFDRDVDIDCERAVGRLMRMAFSGAYRYRPNPLLLAKRTYLEWRNNNRDFARAKENAGRHYGLPFEFFRLMLGDDCLYAEGYWSEGATTLAAAQRRRCDYICRKLVLRPGDRLAWISHTGERWVLERRLSAVDAQCMRDRSALERRAAERDQRDHVGRVVGMRGACALSGSCQAATAFLRRA